MWNNLNFDEAAAYFDRAIDIDPQHGPSYGFKGLLLYSLRRNFTAAEVAFKRSLELTPTDVSVLANYGHLKQCT
ncbi:hypothetical protein T484DRAFT_1775246 [Baffinella frigidus]|nr:hypothetical protein T484DRAFT_1775246 [Cryptophyta sp. CCMP2293]